MTLASAVAAGETVTVSYDKPSANPLRDRGGTELESFSGMPVTNGQPRIEAVEIVSNPTGRRRRHLRAAATRSGFR